jgi:hypothetical protein
MADLFVLRLSEKTDDQHTLSVRSRRFRARVQMNAKTVRGLIGVVVFLVTYLWSG